MSTRPPTKARRQTAWDVGRSGDKPPEWIAGNADLLAAYDDGLAAHDDAVEQAAPKQPAPKPAAAAPVSEPAPGPAAAPATSPSSTTPLPAPPPRPEWRGWAARPIGRGDGSGLLFGLVAYAVFLNFLRDGPQGVNDWCSAKFLNKTKVKTGSW